MTTPVAVPQWAATYAARGNFDQVRISATAMGATPEWSCSEQLAFGARPGVYLDLPYREPARPEYETFALGLIRDVMLRSLGAVDVDGPALSPAAALDQLSVGRNWELESLHVVKAAVNGYFEVFKQLRAAPGWTDARFASSIVASDPSPTGVVEWSAWGVHVVRDAQQVRETHLLRWRSGGRPTDAARVAVIARNLADGFVPKPAKRATPYAPMPAQPAQAQRVIVREIGLLDATDLVIFDGTPDQAREAFAASVPARLTLLTGGAGNPGSRCASCKVVELCPHPVREPGILGVAGRSTAARALTPGDLSMHRSCPASFHLRRELGLPIAARESGLAARRGTLVHAWLAAAHDRGLACTPADLPGDGLGEVAAALGWSADDFAIARPLLVRHLDTCPLAFENVEFAISERALSVIDTDANVVFSTRFDLVAALGTDARLVRETKTINPRNLPDSESDLIDLFPQIAFPIVALAAGLDPVTGRLTGAPLRGRVELELLNDDYASVVQFHLDDVDVVLAARAALAQQVDEVIYDKDHLAYPGAQCRWCPVSDWCPAKSEVEITLSESLDAATVAEEPLLGTLALIARAVVGTDVAGEDDAPF